VLVLGATNRPRTLDAALLRPGRFDRVIYVPPPDEVGRRDILRMECSKWYNDSISLDGFFNLTLLAKEEISGFLTGAEIVGACREAAVDVMREMLMDQVHSSDQLPPKQFYINLLHALNKKLEETLRKTKSLLSSASVLEEYTRFEAEHKS
jgi:SpoVK/Ycf46/Vps4 family AAA+-type ATPase